MKKVCISFLSLTIIILIGIGIVLFSAPTQTQYLRIHIRANSNSQIDQEVKLKVKEKIVGYLVPFVAECNTKEKAEDMVRTKLPEIESVANIVLRNNGFSYKSKATLCTEEFPTRVYGELVLDGGFYDALIVSLGDGKGDNWWCVVYPPLCFVGSGTGYVYRSKIIDIINDFKKQT